MPVKVRFADERAFKYGLKQDPEHIASINTKQKDRMRSRHHTAQKTIAALEMAAKEVLCSESIHTCHYVNYLNFIRECWSLSERFQGEALCIEVAVIQLKWKVRGLDDNALARLRFEILNIGEPATPII